MKKATDEWYKNKTWNGSIDSRFEDQLKRTRNSANKAEYLQIQGCCLLDSPQANIREVGINLLSRLFSDHPAEYLSILAAQEKLGDYYLQQKNIDQALQYFTMVMDHCAQQNSRTGSSGMADLKWAEAILKTNQPAKLEAAYQLVMQYPTTLLKFNDAKFYYAELAALICDRLNKKEEAAAFAKTAISLNVIIKPSLRKFNNTASNNGSAESFRTLEAISII